MRKYHALHRLSVSDGVTNDGTSELGSEGEACPFSKDPSGRYVVLYTFTARDENDVDVERGEFVTGLFTCFPFPVSWIPSCHYLFCRHWRLLRKNRDVIFASHDLGHEYIPIYGHY